MTSRSASAKSKSSSTTTVNEELIEALLDSKLVEALAEALSPFIKKMIDEHVTSRFAALDKSIGELKRSSESLKQESALLKKSQEALKQENVLLRKQLDEHTVRVENLDVYSRSDNLIIKGLPEQSYAERATDNAGGATRSAPPSADSHLAVESTVINFCRDTLKLSIDPSDISTAHRLKAGPKDVVRPIIVRFTSRRMRENVFRAKKLLKTAQLPHRVYISEQLTKAASALFFEARKRQREKKLSSAWTHNGQVFIRFGADASEKATLVKAVSDLNIPQ
jgi:FtsZ-binding cell division protein ZapB